jgi:hypothetical protein
MNPLEVVMASAQPKPDFAGRGCGLLLARGRDVEPVDGVQEVAAEALRDEVAAGVDAHPHLDLHSVRPLLLGERLLGVRGRLCRVTSSREDDEEGLGLAIDDDSAMLVECRLQQGSMFSDDILVALAKAMVELRRALDVGEEKSDGTAR